MRLWLAVAVGAVLGALVVIVLILALAPQESARRANAAPSDEVTAAQCLAIIPDSVFTTLGWTGGASTEHAGRCEKIGDDGYITVGDLAVVASADDRATAAQQVYDDRCSGLIDGGSSTPDLSADWLPDGTTACVHLLPAGQDTGLAELILHTDDGEVVQVRVAALTPTSEESLKAALGQLVATAEERW